uniref:Uncharacterized protein n=1 Tax=Plectus sambesii TaxID=2011161 RepID=A0A914XNU0_9BILA
MLRRRKNRDQNLTASKETLPHDQQSLDDDAVEEESLEVVTKAEYVDRKQNYAKRQRISSKTADPID